MAIDPWARATGGELPFEELRSCIRPAPDDFTTTIQLLIAETCWHLHHQRAIEAIQSAEKAVGIIRHNWVFNLWTISAISLFARSLREHAESLEPTRHRDRRVYWDRSLRIARWAVRGGRFLGIDYATALRELSLSLAGLGRIRTALRYARKSCSVALRQNAKYEYALALQACGRLGERLGRPGSAQEIEQAQLLLDQFRALRQKAMAATWSKGGT
jgi:tetratricopeptide (TPR) repeat protein